MRDELVGGMARFRAKAGAGAIIDVNTGEIIALESLPDFDPNDPPDMTKDPTRINRINVGVYEMGSTFKALSIAMALESGKVNLGSQSMRATACATAVSPSTISTRPIAFSAFPKCSPIPRTSAPRAWR